MSRVASFSFTTDLVSWPKDAGAVSDDEMRRLKEIGLSESDIIRGATIYPARWLGIDHQLGTVSPGKKANVLILNGNPLEDIENIETTYAVLKGGKIVIRE
jgi:imidazolonepropionase-like amidohydrolase